MKADEVVGMKENEEVGVKFKKKFTSKFLHSCG
jgi:hypothetical protein